eukprot:5273411-Pyramimonas_sp.AAC.1
MMQFARVAGSQGPTCSKTQSENGSSFLASIGPRWARGPSKQLRTKNRPWRKGRDVWVCRTSRIKISDVWESVGTIR